MSVEIKADRSPRYPRVSLMEALNHARRLYDGAHRSVLDTGTAFRVLGYAGKTGASATVLGALRQYGLVRGLRGSVAVSDLALRIFEPGTPREYAEGLSEAAETPEAFKAIKAHFGENIPKSDEAVRSFLIRTLGFSKSGAEDCIESFRETQLQVEVGRGEFLSQLASEIKTGSDDGGGEERASVVETLQPAMGSAVQSAAFDPSQRQNTNEFIRVPLAKNCTAELRFEGALSGDAVDRLIAYIQLMKPIWAESDSE